MEKQMLFTKNKIKLSQIFFWLILLAFVIIARDFMVLLFLALYIFLALLFGLAADKRTIYLFMSLVLFQNLILILLSDYLTPFEHTIFSLTKEVMLYFSLVSLLFRSKRIRLNKIDIIALLYVIIVAFNFIRTPASLNASMVSLRQVIVPVICFYVGKCIYIEKKDIQNILKFILYIGIFLAVFGIIELLFLGDNFWVNIGLHQFYINKEGELPGLINGVGVNFYTWDLGYLTRRIVSITADPLATAHLIFLAFAICYTNAANNLKSEKGYTTKFAWMILLFIACLLSISKAILVLLGVGIAIKTYLKSTNKMVKIILQIAVGVGGLWLIFYLVEYYLQATMNTSLTNHIDGLLNGFANATVLGNGLGIAGVMTRKLADSDITTVESYLGTLVEQIGYIGFILFLYFLYSILKEIYLKYKKNQDSYLLLCIILIIGVSTEMFFSESSISIMGTGIYFILIGFVFNKGNMQKLIAHIDNNYKDR